MKTIKVLEAAPSKGPLDPAAEICRISARASGENMNCVIKGDRAALLNLLASWAAQDDSIHALLSKVCKKSSEIRQILNNESNEDRLSD